jgi:hypothetical protein
MSKIDELLQIFKDTKVVHWHATLGSNIEYILDGGKNEGYTPMPFYNKGDEHISNITEELAEEVLEMLDSKKVCDCEMLGSHCTADIHEL